MVIGSICWLNCECGNDDNECLINCVNFMVDELCG